MKCRISNVKKPPPLIVITEEESDSLMSPVCNTVPSHKEAKIVKGSSVDWELFNSKSSLHLREKSVECYFSKSSGVSLTSVSDKQVSVLSENMHSSLDGGKATDHKASPPSGTKLELDVNKLHYNISLLFSDTERKQNDACSLSSDKGKKTKLVSKNKNMLVHNPDVVSEIRQSSSAGNSVACKESTCA
ncbi:hypothetical protein L798_01565 [Zootermopsis nevadensis]|uniref:Uncharacterized protein n=1 Tax=Zootermopsis nevadensis TaxID=136037 RepID=A0A067QIW3_ZOONE|nr:hypothetical protein L798_01565 [Zootermopsis nevadensis]